MVVTKDSSESLCFGARIHFTRLIVAALSAIEPLRGGVDPNGLDGSYGTCCEDLYNSLGSAGNSCLDSFLQEKQETVERTAETIKQINSHFYCETCSKQYYTVLEFEEHNNSYGHHHKKVRAGTPL